MKFRTEIESVKLNLKIDHTKTGLSLGSCFAENIAVRLLKARFKICANPFGALYNPASVCAVLDRVAENRPYLKDEVSEFNSLWHSELHHGDFSGVTAEKTLENINNQYQEAVTALEKSDYVIITLGTVWIYRNAETQAVVSNCHKRPAKDFTREALSAEQVEKMLSKQFDTTLKDKHIILTVSPIRHIKDGLTENSLSKATLIVAAHNLAKKYGGRVEYFPSYEIVNDDLRDYRFYKTDMLHPSDQAVDYIWDIFSAAVFSEQSQKLVEQLQKLTQAAQHRVLNPESEAHQSFCESMLARTKSLSAQHPELDLSDLEQYFMASC